MTFYVVGHAPTTPVAAQFDGYVTIPPMSFKNYTDPADFATDPDTYDFSSTATMDFLQLGTFEFVRGADNPSAAQFGVDPVVVTTQSSAPYILPCSGAFYTATWTFNTVHVN